MVAEHEARGRIDPAAITKAIETHLEGLSVTGSDFLRKSLESLHHYSRIDALNRAGFGREVRRAKLAQTQDERGEQLRQSFDMAFKSVNSLPDDVVERIRAKIMENLDLGAGSTEQVLRALIEEEIEALNIEDPAELREAIKKIWDKTRHDLQRVIRSESINAYSRVQLQEWYDRGLRTCRRRSIDDERTCAICRELSRPGINEYSIEDLLKLDYPVTQDPDSGDWLTHPNCRCWFEPVIEDVWAEIEGIEADLFGDLTRGDATATDVPIDARTSVEKALREHKDLDMQMAFVPKIVDLPEWRKSRRQELETEVGDRAEIVLESEIAFNAVTEWTDPVSGIHYVAGQAQDISHPSTPVSRAAGGRLWDKGMVDHSWVASRYRNKKDEAEATIEVEGYQIFGGEPFPTEVAAESARDYFVESYALYVTQPYILQTTDATMYDWLAFEVFGGREFLQRGGLK